MDSLTGVSLSNASAADPGTVQGAAAVSVLKKALDLQASSAVQLIHTNSRSKI
jgi:Putative motility protein